jgi:hypothetical protein
MGVRSWVMGAGTEANLANLANFTGELCRQTLQRWQ